MSKSNSLREDSYIAKECDAGFVLAFLGLGTMVDMVKSHRRSPPNHEQSPR